MTSIASVLIASITFRVWSSNLIDHSLAVVAAYPNPGIVNDSDDDVQMVIPLHRPG